MTRSAIDRLVRAVQRPGVHERSRHPSIVAVASAAGVREAFVRRVQGVLNIFYMADDAIGTPNLYPSVVLRAAGARPIEQHDA
jgi:hypothetical protein